MNIVSNIILGLILVLLLINLMLTGSIAVKLQETSPALIFDKSEKFESERADALGKKVIGLYNDQNDQALYALFNEKAKVKISHQQLKNQLGNLHSLFNDIEESAFISSVKLGEKSDEIYYQLLFTVRVKDTARRNGTLTLTVIMKDSKLSLYGLKLNATQQLD